MAEQDYFRSALSNFTYEAANGGAIRHLADLGYTVKQIREKLTFPTSWERLQRAVWDRLLDTGVLLLEEPGSGRERVKAAYVVDHDKYGRTSFRLASAPSKEADRKPVLWRERTFEGDSGKGLAGYLAEKCRTNGEEASYISCDFGLQSRREESEFRAAMEILNAGERDYILGLPWENRRCYHRLDQRMREIAVRLYESGRYHGNCYFLKSEERVKL